MRIDGGEPISAADAVYMHTGLTPETSYTYEVRAIYIDTPGNWCDPVTVSTLLIRWTGRSMSMTVWEESKRS